MRRNLLSWFQLKVFRFENKIVDSKASLDDQGKYDCFVAMVETLNNRSKKTSFQNH